MEANTFLSKTIRIIDEDGLVSWNWFPLFVIECRKLYETKTVLG